MEDLEILLKIKQKSNKTKEDEILLRYHNILSSISTILVNESKWHISKEQAIEQIKEQLNRY